MTKLEKYYKSLDSNHDIYMSKQKMLENAGRGSNIDQFQKKIRKEYLASKKVK